MRFTMGIRFDLMKLPDSTKKRMVTAIKTFRKMYPNIELVVIDKAPGVMRAVEYKDFNIFLFMGEEPWETAHRKRFTQPQLSFQEYGFRIEVINSYDPGKEYKRVERIPMESEADLFGISNYRVYDKERGKFLNFLYNNLFCYEARGRGNLAAVTTLNIPAMRSDNLKFYKVYKVNLMERGYMAYHSELKPIPFIHFPAGDKPFPKSKKREKVV